jgi:hypothetical protein
MTGIVIFNLILMAGVVFVIAGGLAWAVATQHRDHGAASAGPLLARRVWSTSPRDHAGSRRPLYARPPYRAEPWPRA